MKRILTCAVIVLLHFQLSVYANNTKSVFQEKPVISKEEAKKVSTNLKNNSAILVDVRTPEEYNEGHLKSSKNIDFKSDDFETQISKLDKSKTIYLYCRSGNRSGKALDVLKTLGFKSVYNIGGFEDLKSAGLPAQ